MAHCYTQYNANENFNCPCRSWYASDLTVNLMDFKHNPNNASQAILTFNHSYKYTYGCVQWVDPSQWMKACIMYSSSTGTNQEKARQDRQRWSGCGNLAELNQTNGSFEGTITSSDSQITCTGAEANRADRPWSFSGPDYCSVTIPLPLTHQVRPPQYISISANDIKFNQVKAKINIHSWSDNPNIKGVPYTLGGGANWNWHFKLLLGTTLIKEQYYPANNELVKEHLFDNLNLSPSTTYTIIGEARNEFQQQISGNFTFTTPKAPSPIQITPIQVKPNNIEFKAKVDEFGTPTAKWDYTIKDSNGNLLFTNFINNSNNLNPTFSFNGPFKMGREFILEVKCTNSAGYYSIGTKNIRIYLGWVVPPSGNAKKILEGDIITSFSNKRINNIKTI